jgi:hypothetical protein
LQQVALSYNASGNVASDSYTRRLALQQRANT